jgi:hypothetical protein
METVTMTACRIAALLSLALSLAACADNASSSGTGSVRVVVSGEEASRSGYPVGSGEDTIEFADGWTLEMRKVLVSFTDFQLRAADGDGAAVDADPVVADLHLGEPELWSFEQVPARRWDRVGYRYAPPTSESRAANDVSEADIGRMIDGGYSLLIEAVAMKDDQAIELEYGFDMEVVHSRCVNGLDETDGLVVPTNATVDAQITVHLDHLFFDSYATDEADLRFDAMAAVAMNEKVTLDDLAAQDNLSDLSNAQGDPLDVAYDPGSVFDPVPEDLREYVKAAATTTGHFNGEGHCDYELR